MRSQKATCNSDEAACRPCIACYVADSTDAAIRKLHCGATTIKLMVTPSFGLVPNVQYLSRLLQHSLLSMLLWPWPSQRTPLGCIWCLMLVQWLIELGFRDA